MDTQQSTSEHSVINRTVAFLIKAAASPLNDCERKEVLANACYLDETSNVTPQEAELLLTAIEGRNASMDGDADFERASDVLVISDEQLSQCFDNAPVTDSLKQNPSKQRAYLANACLKTSAGYWNGGTIFGIMRHLGLVEDIPCPRLTRLGGYFLYQTFSDKALS